MLRHLRALFHVHSVLWHAAHLPCWQIFPGADQIERFFAASFAIPARDDHSGYWQSQVVNGFYNLIAQRQGMSPSLAHHLLEPGHAPFH